MLTYTHSPESDAAIESQVFRALADPSRRQILDRLLVGDASVNELAVYEERVDDAYFSPRYQLLTLPVGG